MKILVHHIVRKFCYSGYSNHSALKTDISYFGYNKWDFDFDFGSIVYDLIILCNLSFSHFNRVLTLVQ